MKLDSYSNDEFDRGRPFLVEGLWMVFQWLFISSWFPGSYFRVFILKLFGAKIGSNVVLKPGLRVKFPWRLTIGDNSWLGESCWLDNLDNVSIGNHCCVSQGSYICTGSHDWSNQTFDLVTKPVVIEDHVWIAANSSIGPGVKVHEGAVLCLGSIATEDLQAWTIYSGVPAEVVRKREVNG